MRGCIRCRTLQATACHRDAHYVNRALSLWQSVVKRSNGKRAIRGLRAGYSLRTRRNGGSGTDCAVFLSPPCGELDGTYSGGKRRLVDQQTGATLWKGLPSKGSSPATALPLRQEPPSPCGRTGGVFILVMGERAFLRESTSDVCRGSSRGANRICFGHLVCWERGEASASGNQRFVALALCPAVSL